MLTKKSRELYLAERFLHELFEGIAYTVSQPDPPLPDIVINLNEKKIGIETTVIIVDEQAKERESNQNAVLNEAQRLFEEQYHLPLHVEVDFIEIANWEKRECQHVAAFLSNAVSECVLRTENLSQYQVGFHAETVNLIHSHVECFSVITYQNPISSPCWSPMTSFGVPSVPIQKIQEIINRKSRNIPGYLTGCDEIWLLMLEAGSPSSYFSHYEELQKITFVSGFAKTLIGRISKGELLALQTKPLSDAVS